MRRTRTFFLAVLTTAISQAYYPFLHYVSRDGQTVALPQKFDLANQPNGRVSFFLSGTPQQLAEGDSLDSLLSQLQLAARQWNEVPTSALRLQFGGRLTPMVESQSGPGIDIVFGEIPPGLLALGGPTVLAEPGPDTTFVPILRSQILLPSDMSKTPSWSDRTFGTLVHEFGHTLGLQHSLTSSAMATDITRTVTKGKALAADDIAGISLLYPTPEFQANLGSISGRISLDGGGVSLASVVAISPKGAAVGTLSAPDGTYRIDGLPPGDYLVYAHPLPPVQSGESTPANIVIPSNVDRNPIPVSGPFNLMFYPAGPTPSDAFPVPVKAGALFEGIDIAVTGRSAPQSIFNVLTYSFPGNFAVRPANVNVGSTNFLVATGNGLMDDQSQPLPGLIASVLGNSASITGIKHYYPGYLQFDLGYTPETGEGTRHLVFLRGNEVYVQPSALKLTTTPPPSLSSISTDDPSTVSLFGNAVGPLTKILFDGAPAAIKAYDGDTGRLTVSIPPSAQNHRATIVAINPDGQSSSFIQEERTTALALTGSAPFGATVMPYVIESGAEGAIEIEAPGANFAPGQVTIGFGTSDIVVKRVDVVSPSKLLAQIQARGSLPQHTYDLTISNGLQTVIQPAAFTMIDGSNARPTVTPLFPNPMTGIATGVAGVSLPFTLSAGIGGNLSATIGGVSVPVRVTNSTAAIIQIPESLSPGLTILRVRAGGREFIPTAVEIAQLPLQAAISNESRSADNTATITLAIPDLHKRISPFAMPRIGISVAGVAHLGAMHLVLDELSFVLLPSVPTGETSIEVSLDGEKLPPVPLTVSR